MSDPQQTAKLIRDVLNDRLNNGTIEHLALEAATLRAYVFVALDSLDHIKQHVERDEIRTKKEMLAVLTHLITTIENRMGNLEDTRLELQRTTTRKSTETRHEPNEM